MNNSNSTRHIRVLVITCIALLAVAALPLLTSGHSLTASKSVTTATSVNIVNNSSRDVRNVYLSHVDADDWGADILTNGSITPGHSATLNNLACDQQQVKVIGEDQDGCFLSTVVTCGESATWTITNTTAADCGGN